MEFLPSFSSDFLSQENFPYLQSDHIAISSTYLEYNTWSLTQYMLYDHTSAFIVRKMQDVSITEVRQHDPFIPLLPWWRPSQSYALYAHPPVLVHRFPIPRIDVPSSGVFSQLTIWEFPHKTGSCTRANNLRSRNQRSLWLWRRPRGNSGEYTIRRKSC